VPASYTAEQLLAALHRSPAHVAVLQGPRFVYQFVNETYAAIVAIKDPIGKPFGESNHESTVALRAALERVRATGEAWSHPELRLELPGPDGAPRTLWFSVRFIPLFDGDRVDGILLHSYDVTELVLAREQAHEHAALRAKMQEVQKLESLGVLAGGVAHDFNNMLAVVLGNVSAAASRLPADSAAQPLLAAAADGARRAGELTRQLLTYAGKARTETRAVDLSSHARDVAHLLAAALPRSVAVQLDLQPDLAPIEADPAQVQQVVMNLLMNAGEAVGEAGGRVVVSTGAEELDATAAAALWAGERLAAGRYAFVEVQDDGPGMDEATRARIFDPFFSTKAKGPSARGLGLAAVTGIVRSHGGGIRVRTTPGAGTTMRVLFPFATRTVRAPAPAEPDDWRGSGRVLVVDDDPGVRATIAAMLEFVGFEVLRASDGQEALALAAAHPDLRLVVLDMTMPGMTGEQVLRELRKAHPALAVLVATGYGEGVARAAMPERTAFLPKPFTMAEMLRAVRAAISVAS
jgi:signal transduction histidine kinase